MTANERSSVSTSDPAEVALHGLRADGERPRRTGRLPPGARSAATARAWLSLSERASDSDRPDLAADAAQRGVEALGDVHVDPDNHRIVDDTDLKLMLADETDHDGQRAALRQRVLESRLVMFGWRYEDLGCGFDPPLDDGRGQRRRDRDDDA